MCANVISKHYNGNIFCVDCYCQQIDASLHLVKKTGSTDSVKTQHEMLQELSDCGWVVSKSSVAMVETLDL